MPGKPLQAHHLFAVQPAVGLAKLDVPLGRDTPHFHVVGHGLLLEHPNRASFRLGLRQADGRSITRTGSPGRTTPRPTTRM